MSKGYSMDIQHFMSHGCYFTYHTLRGMLLSCHRNVIWNCCYWDWRLEAGFLELEAGFLMVWALRLSISPGSTFSMKLLKARVQRQFTTQCCCLLVLCSSFWLALKKLRRNWDGTQAFESGHESPCVIWPIWLLLPVKNRHTRSTNDSQLMNQPHKAQTKCNSSSVLVFSSGTCEGKALFQTFCDFLPLILANFKLHCIVLASNHGIQGGFECILYEPTSLTLTWEASMDIKKPHCMSSCCPSPTSSCTLPLQTMYNLSPQLRSGPKNWGPELGKENIRTALY